MAIVRIPENEIIDSKIAKELYKNMALFQDCSVISDFRNLCKRFDIFKRGGLAIDIGSGTGNFSAFFAFEYKDLNILAVDGSKEAISYGQRFMEYFRIQDQVKFKHLYLPARITNEKADLIISRATLHHFKNPLDFWNTVKDHMNNESAVYILTLKRPNSMEELEPLKRYVREELVEARLRSYVASYTKEEMIGQIKQVGLEGLTVLDCNKYMCVIYRDYRGIYN